VIDGVVAIRGCGDAAFVARTLAKINSPNPVRHFPRQQIICANFDGSENLRDWLGNIRWEVIEGNQCGFFKRSNSES